jgi:hypothetical protein
MAETTISSTNEYPRRWFTMKGPTSWFAEAESRPPGWSMRVTVGVFPLKLVYQPDTV